MKHILVLLSIFIISFGFSQTEKIDSLSIQILYQKFDSLKVRTSLELVKLLYEEEDYKKALIHINISEELSKSINFTEGQALNNYYKAKINNAQKNYRNAETYYKQSRQYFKQINDLVYMAKINNRLGEIAIVQGNYKSGLSYFIEAVKIFEANDLKNELGIAYQNIANTYHKATNLEKALEYNLKSLKIKGQLQDSLGIYNVHKSLAKLFSEQKEHEKAILYYQNLIILSKTDSLELSDLLPKISNEYIALKDYSSADDNLNAFFKINKSYKTNTSSFNAYNAIAGINIRKKRYTAAERQLENAGKLVSTLDNDVELLKHYKLRKRLDSTLKRFASAYKWQAKYFELKGKIEEITINSISKDTSNTIIPIEEATTIETVIPEQQGNNLTKEQEANTKGKLKSISYALIAVLVTVIAFLLFNFFKRRNSIKYTKDLESKNKEIKQKNKDMLGQAEHLEEVNKVKDKLFSIISHDLKDSLTSIQGFLDLLKDNTISREEFDGLISELSDSANNATLLLFNLLNWSKSQMQALEPNPSLFDIQEVFAEKIKLIEHKIESKQINLVDHTLRDFVYADRSMIEIIVQNLLANAVKFSKAGDSITITNHISNGESIICVEDTGVGISKDNLELLFKSNTFTTLGTKSEKGTGLGLTICKDLVELNYGKIWAESEASIGSKFYFKLPKSKVLAPYANA